MRRFQPEAGIAFDLFAYRLEQIVGKVDDLTTASAAGVQMVTVVRGGEMVGRSAAADVHVGDDAQRGQPFQRAVDGGPVHRGVALADPRAQLLGARVPARGRQRLDDRPTGARDAVAPSSQRAERMLDGRPCVVTGILDIMLRYHITSLSGMRDAMPPGASHLAAAFGGLTVVLVDDDTVAVPGDVIKVFLLDDHEVVRRGLAALLTDEPGFDVVGTASTAAQAEIQVAALRPDVAIISMRLPDTDGVSACRSLRSSVPGLACLFLTAAADEATVFDAVMAGAAGYVLHHTHGPELLHAVRTVAGGVSLLAPDDTARVQDQIHERVRRDDLLATLSERERRILDLIGDGLTNRQIGDTMFLAEKTVKNHMSSILTKLGMKRRTQVAALSAQLKSKPKQRD